MEQRFKEIDFKVFDKKACSYIFVDIKTGNTLNIIQRESEEKIRQEMGWDLF